MTLQSPRELPLNEFKHLITNTMKKLLLVLSLFLLIYACGKDSEVKVENPLNYQNVKKIAELEYQLAFINSTLSESGTINQNLTKQVDDLQKQLTSTQSLLETSEQTNTSLESQIDSLNVKVADLGLIVWTSLGIQDGIYDKKKYHRFFIDPVSNDTLFNGGPVGNLRKKIYGEVKNGVLVKRTANYEIDLYGDPSNRTTFTKWELKDEKSTDSIYISGLYEITVRSKSPDNLTISGGNSYSNIDRVEYTVWKFEDNLTVEAIPAQTFKEINKFVVENSNVGILADSIYTNIDPFDPISLREGFILDAQRNGLDISYLRNEKITIETVDLNYGVAYGEPCNSGKISIFLEDTWAPIYKPQRASPLNTMFHEMGHSALNLMHSNVEGDLMWGRGSVAVESSSDLQAITDPLTQLREQTKRMFQNIEQISANCGFASQKGGGGLIVD